MRYYWLLSNTRQEWVKRYNTRIEDYHQPKSKSKREEWANIYGEDGLQLLNAVFDSSSPDWLRKIPAVETLRRAGIEGTMSEGVRVHHLRRTRYVGLKKTHLQHLMTAVAINLKRLFIWLMGIPLATTRSSRYSQLMTNPVTS